MSRSILNDNCIPLSPVLAEKIGLNEAIVVQQVHYWIEMYRHSEEENIRIKHFHDGKWWIYNTYEEWQKQFPFWCLRTLKNVFKKLVDKEYLLVGHFNIKKYDRTNWYTVNYDKIENLVNTHSATSALSIVQDLHNPLCNIDTTYTIEYTENNFSKDNHSYITFSHKGEKSNRPDDELDFDIVIKQIELYCNKHEENRQYKDDLISTFRYFYNCYKEHIGKDHIRISQENLNDTCGILIWFALDYLEKYEIKDYETMIHYYFEQNYKGKINYSILHFTNKKIMKNLYYKYVYQ